MNCPNCGAVNSSRRHYCGRCKSDLHPESSERTNSELSSNSDENLQAHTSSRSRRHRSHRHSRHRSEGGIAAENSESSLSLGSSSSRKIHRGRYVKEGSRNKVRSVSSYKYVHNNSIVLSVVACFFCLPLGLWSLYCSIESNKAAASGDIINAESLNAKAKVIAIAGFILWFICSLFAIIHFALDPKFAVY